MHVCILHNIEHFGERWHNIRKLLIEKLRLKIDVVVHMPVS